MCRKFFFWTTYHANDKNTLVHHPKKTKIGNSLGNLNKNIQLATNYLGSDITYNFQQSLKKYISKFLMGGQCVLSLIFCELSKMIWRKYTMLEITLMVKILSWNFVRVPNIMTWNTFHNIVSLRGEFTTKKGQECQVLMFVCYVTTQSVLSTQVRISVGCWCRDTHWELILRPG